MHVTLGGISMSQATLVHLCRLAALRCNTATQHHVRLVDFLTDKLCGWQPTPLAEWPFSKWTSLEARGMLIHLRSHMLISASQHVRWKLPFRLASWMQSIGSKFDLALS